MVYFTVFPGTTVAYAAGRLARPENIAYLLHRVLTFTAGIAASRLPS